jgi:hypothetical protein
MDDPNIEERLNDEGFAMNREYDSEEGYRVLQNLGIPPTGNSMNNMGVGEYDSSFFSEVMNNKKIERDEELDEAINDRGNMEPKKFELENGDKELLGYISNEIYYPIEKDKKVINKNVEKNTDGGIMGMRVGELFENTSMVLNNFDEGFLKALHKVDIEFGYTYNNEGMITNIKRYIMAFMIYLQEGNNILYIGITLFIISIILYFINIIRKND